LKFLRYFLISLLISTCTVHQTYNYTIESSEELEKINMRLIIDVFFNNPDTPQIKIQAFPKELDNIEEIEIVFDMKFREDYSNNFNGICVGPEWTNFGSGEFSVSLKKNTNFKAVLTGELNTEDDDRCSNYFYYARYLTIRLNNQIKYNVGVATDYAGAYPDAPTVWKVNKDNEIDLIFMSNIETYSINFELSK